MPSQTRMDRMREDAGWGSLHSPLLVSSLNNGTLADTGPHRHRTTEKPLAQLEESVPCLLGASLTALGGEGHDSPFLTVT